MLFPSEGLRAGGRLTLGLLAACAVVTAAQADTLRPYEASYAGIWHGLTVAVSTLKLEQTGDTWTYSSRSEPRGIGRIASGVFPPRQVSVVRVGADGVEPQSYESEGGDAARRIELKYDWQDRRVTGSYEGTAVDLPLTPQIQDDASVQLALMTELLAARRPQSFQLIDKKSVRAYQLTRDGEATIQTPLGPMQTVVYKAQKAYSPRVTRFWCAPSRGYIPLRVQQRRGEDIEWTMEILSLKRE